MRFFEFKPVQHIKPRPPPEARIYKLKRTAELAKNAVKSERAAQKRQKEIEQQRKKLNKGRPTNNPNQTL